MSDTEGQDLPQRLEAAVATVLAEISRTDAKSGVLLTALSLPLAVLVASVPNQPLPGLASILVASGAVGLVLAMLVVLVVVRPHLGGAARGSYLHWSIATDDEVVQDLTEPTNQVDHVRWLSRIAKRKYRGLQLAIDITGGSLVSLGLALVAALW
ncbi:Pycsar system effector family protein [Streptomyces sp. NPDC085612]|uniref:Pycsar system effector family protein n=1 Tax=Streptomyces sp. NPDC085612 TaxID=3365732 RepID=UPI0037D85FFF